MKIDPETYARLAAEISSDDSPVGIDARKTHVMILHLLEQLHERIEHIERQLEKGSDDR